jgi:hypothetical protein
MGVFENDSVLGPTGAAPERGAEIDCHRGEAKPLSGTLDGGLV